MISYPAYTSKLFFSIFLSKIACQAPSPIKNSSNPFPTIDLANKRKVGISYVPFVKIELEARKKAPGKPGASLFNNYFPRISPISPLPGRIWP